MFGLRFISVTLTFSFILFARIECFDDASPKQTGTTVMEKVIEYLKAYGYLTEDDSNKSDSIPESISKFQSLMGIYPNGGLDKMTRNLMKQPRCGEKDIQPKTRKRFPLMKDLMKRKVLRYNIKNWTKWIPRTLQNQTIYNMFRIWTDDLQIKCQWSVKNADVDIIFKPAEKESLKLNDYSIYTKVKIVNGKYNVYFFSRATQSLPTLSRSSAHAFGHIFGHDHSNLYSLMSPIFRDTNRKIFNARCFDMKIDSAFFIAQDHVTTSFMSEGLVWRIQNNYTFNLPPVPAKDLWPQLPSKFDDGFSWPNNWRTYIFKGSMSYRFDGAGKHVDEGYPQPISAVWPGVPSNIDAVISTQDGLTYFFKGDQVYRFDDDEGRVAQHFPKPIKEVFAGIPSNIDSAFRYYFDNIVYFFKGSYFYRWNGTMSDGPFVTMYDWHNLCDDPTTQ